MGVIGGIDVLDKLKEDKAKTIVKYSDMLKKVLIGEEIDMFEKMELSFPCDYENWLNVIESLSIASQEQILRCFVNNLKSNIEIAKIKDKERPPEICYDALRIYQIRLSALLSMEKHEPPLNKSEVDVDNKTKDFTEILNHENMEKLMKKLHELLDNQKGKNVAIVIRALERTGIISICKSRNELYALMKKHFGDIGSSQSINKYMYSTEKTLVSEIDRIGKILESV